MTLSRKIFLFIVLNVAAMRLCALTSSSDTIKISLKDAEKRFLDQNLDLLIAKTDIDQAKGLLLQSKLYDNPSIDFERQLYDYDKKEFFPTSNYQYYASFNQLIKTAGKYVKGIQIARQQVKLSEYEYYDVLRALKYALKENFYQIYQDQQKMNVLANGINELNKLIDAITIQVEKGYVAKKELVRLQSSLLDFMNDQTEAYNRITESESELKQLLSYKGNEYIIPQVEDSVNTLPSKIEKLVFDSLQSIAFANRYDLLAAGQQADIGKNEWQLAKKQAIPDVSIGADYDRLGTFNSGYSGLMLQLPVPLWNLNQGNVKAAKAQYDQLRLEKDKKELEVHNTLQQEYAKLLNENRLYKLANKNYQDSFEEIYKNIYDSYKSRTINLIEFLEYFESYKDTKFNLIEINSGLLIQSQKLNFELGKDIF